MSRDVCSILYYIGQSYERISINLRIFLLNTFLKYSVFLCLTNPTDVDYLYKMNDFLMYDRPRANCRRNMKLHSNDSNDSNHTISCIVTILTRLERPTCTCNDCWNGILIGFDVITMCSVRATSCIVGCFGYFLIR